MRKLYFLPAGFFLGLMIYQGAQDSILWTALDGLLFGLFFMLALPPSSSTNGEA